MNAVNNRAMNQYKQVGTRVSIDSADSHQLIVMLFDGALERIAIAKGAMARNEIELKGEKIGRAIAIIDGLKAALDNERGGEISQNLNDLYDYMQRRLFDANAANDQAILDEVTDLIREIRQAWMTIPVEYRLVNH